MEILHTVDTKEKLSLALVLTRCGSVENGLFCETDL